MKLGLTGDMGAGKSSVLGIFRELGWQVIDCDVLVHDLLRTDLPLIQALVGRFGKAVLSEKDGIDRRALGARVFSDPEALGWLEEQLHPKVRERWRQALEANPNSNWVIEIPLLFESGLETYFDYTLCISVNPNLQEKRLKAKAYTPEHIAARKMRQMPADEKAKRADFCIDNNGTLEDLRKSIIQLDNKLKHERTG